MDAMDTGFGKLFLVTLLVGTSWKSMSIASRTSTGRCVTRVVPASCQHERMDTKPALLKPSEVAARLRLSQTTIYAMVRRGDIPAARLGPKTIRVRAEVVDELLKAGK